MQKSRWNTGTYCLQHLNQPHSLCSFSSTVQSNGKDSVACKKTVENKYVPLAKA